MKYTTCVSVAADTPDAMSHDLHAALESSKYAEVRLDCMDSADVAPFLESVSNKMSRLILTVRPRKEGGWFSGSESERIPLLESVAAYDPFLLDVEYNTLLTNPGLRSRLGTDILVSWHNFRGSSSAVLLRRRMAEMKKYSEWIKLVVTAETRHDAASIMSLYAYRGRINLVAFAMGDAGRFTRLCSMHLGCPFMYVSLGDPVAPGQYSLNDVDRLSGVM